MVVPGGANLSRKVLDELQEFAKRYGAGALAWIKLGDETLVVVAESARR